MWAATGETTMRVLIIMFCPSSLCKKTIAVKIPFLDRQDSFKKPDNPIYVGSLWILHLLGCFIVGESCSRCHVKHFCHGNLTPPERRRHNIPFTLGFCRHSLHLPHLPLA